MQVCVLSAETDLLQEDPSLSGYYENERWELERAEHDMRSCLEAEYEWLSTQREQIDKKLRDLARSRQNLVEKATKFVFGRDRHSALACLAEYHYLGMVMELLQAQRNN